MTIVGIGRMYREAGGSIEHVHPHAPIPAMPAHNILSPTQPRIHQPLTQQTSPRARPRIEQPPRPLPLPRSGRRRQLLLLLALGLEKEQRLCPRRGGSRPMASIICVGGRTFWQFACMRMSVSSRRPPPPPLPSLGDDKMDAPTYNYTLSTLSRPVPPPTGTVTLGRDGDVHHPRDPPTHPTHLPIGLGPPPSASAPDAGGASTCVGSSMVRSSRSCGTPG